MPEENRAPDAERERAEKIRGKEQVGAVIYAVISVVNFKICYDFVSSTVNFADFEAKSGEGSLFLLWACAVGAGPLPAACTSAAAGFSRWIVGAPIWGTSYYVVATAVIYAPILRLVLGAGLLLIIPVVAAAALSMISTHAVITYEKGKPFRI